MLLEHDGAFINMNNVNQMKITEEPGKIFVYVDVYFQYDDPGKLSSTRIKFKEKTDAINFINKAKDIMSMEKKLLYALECMGESVDDLSKIIASYVG